jgi:predicted AAA+ superfamily ATPase
MNEGELHRQLTAANPWWRDPTDWQRDDPDLRRLREARLDYEPRPLADIAPDGLYVLRGPRRVGKSVELKRAVAGLIADGVAPRRIIHFSCDGLSALDLRRLVRVGRDQATRQVEEPRYWLLDEITAVGGWPQTVKWLRDNTAMAVDCVVLTGSSGKNLEQARKELAGRRGQASRSDRLLLPMSFRAFCAAQRLSGLPAVDPVRPADFLGRTCREATDALLPWLDDLVSLWQLYCRVGGFPRAVTDSLAHGDVGDDFAGALWDVIHGDALTAERFSAAQSLQLLLKLSKDLTSPVNRSAVAEQIGVGSYHTAGARIRDLVDAYLAWPCHQRGAHQLPNLRAREKVYFTDPLLARLAHLRTERLPEPDTSKISEQQLGFALVRALSDGDPGRYADFTSVMYARSATGREVDFCGPELGGVAFEGKYVDANLARESQTMRTMFPGRGVLATRSWFEDVQGARAIPAPLVAYLLLD